MGCCFGQNTITDPKKVGKDSGKNMEPRKPAVQADDGMTHQHASKNSNDPVFRVEVSNEFKKRSPVRMPSLDNDEFEKQLDMFIDPPWQIRKLLTKHPLKELPHTPNATYARVLKNRDGECYRYFGELVDHKKHGYGLMLDVPTNQLIVGMFKDDQPTGKLQVYTVSNYCELEMNKQASEAAVPTGVADVKVSA